MVGWDFPAPKVEAAALVKIADRNGGRAAMRALIQVSEVDERALFELAKKVPALTLRIERALEFRRKVLAEFDRLTGEGAL